MTPRQRAGALLVALLLLAGCGVEPQDGPEQVPQDRLPAPSPTAADRSGSGRIWGARGGELVPVFVQLPDRELPARLDALLALRASTEDPPTVIPAGTRVVRLEQSGTTYVLTLSEQVRAAPVRDLSLLVAQLVLTATEVPGVERVEVREAERLLELVGSDGRPVRRPLTRDDVASFAAAGTLER